MLNSLKLWYRQATCRHHYDRDMKAFALFGFTIAECKICGKIIHGDNKVNTVIQLQQNKYNKGKNMTIGELKQKIAKINSANGWYENKQPLPVQIALIHSELSEVIEADRNGEDAVWYGENNKPEGTLVELADVVIRVLDTVHTHFPGYNFEAVIEDKLEFNESRGYKHGGKKY